MPDHPDAVDDAARTLYALPPEEFLAKRSDLSAQSRTEGNGAAAQSIDKLRKPTAAAWIVNVLALTEPSIVDDLIDLGGRLREAQDALDAGRLRELSTERRSLVAKLTKDAFALAGRRQPAAGLRDEVTGTFDAAIADGDIAARLGRLPRPEKWSGFGFLPTGGPELTLVRGGRDDSPAPAPQSATPRVTAAEKRKQERALAAARAEFEAAETAFDRAREAEQDLSAQTRRLAKKLAKVQTQLDEARAELETARKDVTSTRSKRREARSALDRAERDAGA